MYWLVALMSLGIVGLIACGLYLELRPAGGSGERRWHKPAIGINLMVFLGAQIGLLLLGIQDAMAEPELAAVGNGEISIG